MNFLSFCRLETTYEIWFDFLTKISLFFRLTDGFGIHLLAIGSGLLYVGEYLPAKQAPDGVIGPCRPVGPLEPIILSGEYISTQSTIIKNQTKHNYYSQCSHTHTSNSHFLQCKSTVVIDLSGIELKLPGGCTKLPFPARGWLYLTGGVRHWDKGADGGGTRAL